MSNKELLPCPFCGGEAKYDNSEGHDYIFCDECGARTFGFNKEHAFNEWNKRAKYVNNVNNKSNSSEKPNSSKVNQSVQVPEVVENGNCKYLSEECCNKSCKEENATCKKNLQLTRSDIEKMVEPVEDLPLFEAYENRTCLIKSGCFSLNEVKGVFKNELVDLICSALRIEE